MADGSPQVQRLTLPPLFRPYPADGRGAFAHALMAAHERAPGTGDAGAFLHDLRADRLEIAVVLEPEFVLDEARLVLLLGLDAVADGLVGALPPGSPVTAGWPDAVRIGTAVVGGVRLWSPFGCEADQVPDRLVLGASLRLAVVGAGEPGTWTRGTSLSDEGLPDADPAALAELLAAHLMSRIDLWLTEGFEPIAASVVARLSAGDGARISATGDLIGPDGETLAAFPAAGAAPSWLDPETGDPWL